MNRLSKIALPIEQNQKACIKEHNIKSLQKD